MAVQLLENWLLKEQEKIQTKYRHLNQVSVGRARYSSLLVIPLLSITLCRNYLGLQKRLLIEAFVAIRQDCY